MIIPIHQDVGVIKVPKNNYISNAKLTFRKGFSIHIKQICFMNLFVIILEILERYEIQTIKGPNFYYFLNIFFWC